jgi:hypothetical protein
MCRTLCVVSLSKLWPPTIPYALHIIWSVVHVISHTDTRCHICPTYTIVHQSTDNIHYMSLVDDVEPEYILWDPG